MKQKRLQILFILAISMVLLIGCGSGGSTTTTPSKFQFVKRGNVICSKAFSEQTVAFERATLKGKQLTEEGAEIGRHQGERLLTGPVFEVIAGMIEELKELGLPRDDQKAANRVIRRFEQGLEEAEHDPRLFFTGEAFRPAVDAARAYGLTECRV